jgi:hypothetical protein
MMAAPGTQREEAGRSRSLMTMTSAFTGRPPRASVDASFCCPRANPAFLRTVFS